MAGEKNSGNMRGNPRIFPVIILAAVLASSLFYFHAADAAAAQNIRFVPAERTVSKFSTATIDLMLDSAPKGLAGYAVDLSLSSPGKAEIVSVTYPAWASLNRNDSLPADRVMISGVDLHSQVESGATDILLATLTVRGDDKGKTGISVIARELDADDGSPIMAGAHPGQIKVVARDTTAPATKAVMLGIRGLNGWYRSCVIVALIAADPDDPPGVITTLYRLDQGAWTRYTGPFVVSGDAEHTLCYMSTDAAGNEERAQYKEIKIDATDPEISISVPADGSDYILKSKVAADWSVSDATSGVAGTLGTTRSGARIETGTAGTMAYGVLAMDRAGNLALRIVSYHVGYKYGGVLPPLSDAMAASVKAGNSVQVGFTLYDDGNKAVSDAVARLYVAPIVDGMPGAEMPANCQVRSGTNRFVYSKDGKCYTMSLSTKSLAKGLWQLRIELDDGTSKYAEMRLT